MTPYIELALGIIYLASMILNFGKVPKHKRQYIPLFGIGFLLGITMICLGLLFPAEASSIFGMISGIIAAIIALGLFGYSIYKIKREEREVKKKKTNQPQNGL